MQRDNARSESIAPPVRRPSRDDDDDDALARKRVATFTTKRDKRGDPMIEDAIEW
jgi:hypothetical protein